MIVSGDLTTYLSTMLMHKCRQRLWNSWQSGCFLYPWNQVSNLAIINFYKDHLFSVECCEEKESGH